jgi:4-amino-4-deoxy-L-arabinose transferase-like glycosyltransferase
MKNQAQPSKTLIIASIIFLIVLGATYAAHHHEYPAWDAAAYLVTGDFFFGKVYLYDDPRPPVVPLIWGITAQVTKNLDIMGMLDIIIRALSCVVVYIFARKYLRDLSSFFLALLTGISIVSLRIPLFFSEFIALIFLLLSLEHLIKLDQRKAANFKLYLQLFLFAGLAVLTRYPMLVYGVVLILVFADNWRVVKHTWKELVPAIALSSIPLILWGIYNYMMLDNPFASFIQSFTAVSNDQFSLPWYYYIWSSHENIFVLLTIALILVIYGAYAAWNNRMRIIASLPLIFLIFQSYIHGKLTRYMFYFLFFSYFLAFYGLEHWMSKQHILAKKQIVALSILFIILLSPIFYTNPSNENWKGKEFYQNGLTLRQITPQDAILIAEHSPQIAYAAERKTYTLHGYACEEAKCPEYPVGLNRVYGCEQVDYVVTDTPIKETCLEEYYINETEELYVYSLKLN